MRSEIPPPFGGTELRPHFVYQVPPALRFGGILKLTNKLASLRSLTYVNLGLSYDPVCFQIPEEDVLSEDAFFWRPSRRTTTT